MNRDNTKTNTAFHNKPLILICSYEFPNTTKACLNKCLPVLEEIHDLNAVIIDNASSIETKHILQDLDHPRLKIIYLEQNIGKANAFNQFIKNTLSQHNCPSTLISMDSDISFSSQSLENLIEASIDIPNLGMLGMRYTKNQFNPELRPWWNSYKTGRSGKKYSVCTPIMANIPGGIFAVSGEVLSQDLQFQLYPNSDGKIYYGDDAALYDKLKKTKRHSLYLNNTEATHWKSSTKTLIPDSIPSKELHFSR